ncbi:MAG: hypothetical protein N3F06_00155, partial [Nitrososphaerales archaeon]|nr:hypothetical protein [Nitrososphaerales archaeon]
MYEAERKGKEKWIFDTVFFEASIRKSGNSLVITIPPELARRFLLSEGQKVRLIGAVKRGTQAEGAISINLGRFLVRETVQGIEFKLTGNQPIDKLPDFVEEVTNKYSATRVTIKPTKPPVCRIAFGSITSDGVIARTGREIREAMEELAEKVESSISDLKIYDEEIIWQDLDPAIIS